MQKHLLKKVEWEKRSCRKNRVVKAVIVWLTPAVRTYGREEKFLKTDRPEAVNPVYVYDIWNKCRTVQRDSPLHA